MQICDKFIMVIIMRKIVLNIIIGVWVAVAIFTTMCLLSFNKYRVAEFGNISIFTLDTDILEPDFKQGSLMITKKTNHKHINSGDNIFYYEESSNDAIVNIGTVVNKKEITSTMATYTMQNEQSISSDNVLGKENGTKVIPFLGYIVSLFESKWGFMFLVIFPAILLLVYEVFEIINEVKSSKKETQIENEKETQIENEKETKKEEKKVEEIEEL